MITVKVRTRTCWACREDGYVVMPAEAYARWAAGAHIQDAWPEGSSGDREQLISGTHPKCRDAISEPPFIPDD